MHSNHKGAGTGVGTGTDTSTGTGSGKFEGTGTGVGIGTNADADADTATSTVTSTSSDISTRSTRRTLDKRFQRKDGRARHHVTALGEFAFNVASTHSPQIVYFF
jgi:hypothetical protein